MTFQTTHGLSAHKMYSVWNNMRRRCSEPTNNRYHRYGALGITVCERWQNSVENFYADMGDPPFSGATLERKQSHLGYEPSNVVWATQKTQQRHRSNNVRFDHDGLSLTAAEWGERVGINTRTMASRLLLRHWPIQRAISEPVRMDSRNRSEA